MAHDKLFEQLYADARQNKTVAQIDKTPPLAATEDYLGPGEFAASVARGALFGGVGYGVGSFIGNMGDRHLTSPKHIGMAARTWQTLLGVGFAIVGIMTASKEIRSAYFQYRKLQKETIRLHDDNVELKVRNHALKDELHQQIHARHGRPHHATLHDIHAPDQQKKPVIEEPEETFPESGKSPDTVVHKAEMADMRVHDAATGHQV